MKKVILAVFSLLSISIASHAQDAAKKAPAADTKMKAAAPAEKKESAKVVPMAKTKTAKAAPAASPAATATATPMKKDGTPDKRYKAKTAAAGPTKKDGTPDMRYKENKAKPKS
ncbi:MAG: hypothetical protein ABI402_00800 [Ferruginibacter sp.]